MYNFTMKVLILLGCLTQLVMAQANSTSTSQGDVWTVQCDPLGPDPLYLTPLPSPIEKPRPINDTLVFILLLSRTAVRICDELLHKAAYELNKTGEAVPGVESSPLDAIPEETIQNGTMKIESILTNAIGRLSRVGVFLDLALNDTAEYDRKLGTLNRKLTEIFCEMYYAMTRLAPEVDPSINVQRGIIKPQFKGLDDIMRHQRNYVSIKRARGMFGNFIDALQRVTQFRMGPNYEILKH